MKMTYDSVADAAYITLGESVKAGAAAEQVTFIETPNGQTQVTIDVDNDGFLLGFEILSASLGLRKAILDAADPI